MKKNIIRKKNLDLRINRGAFKLAQTPQSYKWKKKKIKKKYKQKNKFHGKKYNQQKQKEKQAIKNCILGLIMVHLNQSKTLIIQNK